MMIISSLTTNNNIYPITNPAKNKTAGKASTYHFSNKTIFPKYSSIYNVPFGNKSNQMTEQEFINFLINLGYTPCKSRARLGELEIEIPNIKELTKNRKNLSLYRQHKLSHLNKDRLKDMLALMNIQNGKHRKYWEEHPDYFMEICANLDESYIRLGRNIPYFSEGATEAVMDGIYSKPNQEISSLINYYQNCSAEYNEYLSETKSNNEIMNNDELNIKSEIDKLTDFIDLCEVKKPFTVYRGDNYKILRDTILPSGKNLKKEMDRISQKKVRNSEIKELEEEVLDSCIKTHNKRFTSTCISKYVFDESEFHDEKAVWNINLPKGTKGLFIGLIGDVENYGVECEFLIQRGSDLKINSIVFDKKNNQWIIDAAIEKIDYKND